MATVQEIIEKIDQANEAEQSVLQLAGAARGHAESISQVTSENPVATAAREGIAALFAHLRSEAALVQESGTETHAYNAYAIYGSALDKSYPAVQAARTTMFSADTMSERVTQVQETINKGEQQLLGALDFVLGSIATQGYRLEEAAQETAEFAEETLQVAASHAQRIIGQ